MATQPLAKQNFPTFSRLFAFYDVSKAFRMTTISRRLVLAGALSALSLSAQAPTAEAQIVGAASIAQRLAELERRHTGRICVSVLDLATGEQIAHRANERVLLCSTFKVLALSNILHRVDKGFESLDRRLFFYESDVVDYSPVTSRYAGASGMSLSEICEAGLVYSDNTSANLMLAAFGGPAALTAFCREIGDDVTRLDRAETDMNYPDGPEDQRDTTTAAAMAKNLQKLFFEDILSLRSRYQLASWMVGCKTGYMRLRAGLPDYWLTADKTGTNNDKIGSANDIAVVWPNKRGPLIISAYCEIPGISAKERNSIVAEIGRIVSGL